MGKSTECLYVLQDMCISTSEVQIRNYACMQYTAGKIHMHGANHRFFIHQ